MPINQEVGLRMSKTLKNKIKRAALHNTLSMIAYLDKIVPEIKTEEIKK